MKKIKYLLLFFTATFILSACSEWLDVTPPSQIREEEQFSTVEGFQQVLTGCYIGMTNDYLYGRVLSWSTIELMAGQFTALYPSTSNDSGIATYNYTSTIAITYINGTWLKAYNVIANVNNALKYIELKKSVLDDINYKLIKGELLAIRAYMHLDLMRLYGYGNLAARNDISAKYAIPYVTTLDKNITPQLSYSQTFALLIKDLTDAVTLLEIDPVTKSQPDSYYQNVNTDGFYNNRQQKFNYYATSLLLARAYMWEGSSDSRTKALVLANKVIADAVNKGVVSWATSESVTGDVIMKSEHLMSLNTQNLLIKTAEYFKIQILATDYRAQYVSNDRLVSVYEAEGIGSTDFRFSKQYIFNTALVNGKNSYTPLKYYGNSITSTSDYIPLLRLPEAYYIAAECLLKQSVPDVNGALNLLNTVRANRGILANLTNLTATDAMNEVVKEYIKEYYCEGAAFFLYKRLGITSIPGYSQSATDAIYVLPYPSDEVQMGRTQ